MTCRRYWGEGPLDIYVGKLEGGRHSFSATGREVIVDDAVVQKLFEEEPVRTRVIRGSRTDGATMNGVEKGLWAESTRAMRDGGGARVSCSLGMRDRAVEDI
jgi:hypothetical protein